MPLLSVALRAALLAAVAAPTVADQPVETSFGGDFAGAPFSSATADPWPPGHPASAARRMPSPLPNKDPS